MYQTVGHKIIPLYEGALGIPLYREEIRGSAINSDKVYHPVISLSTDVDDNREEDETESMLRLLQRIVQKHPGVNAVSTGAILSDYQRTRVESVATRLGLIPLSYLWQYPNLSPGTETSLLADMEAIGQDARIIKCASGGLDASFLWNNVAFEKTSDKLMKVMNRYGPLHPGAVLGEGGEYETLAIDGPAPLWKKRIQVEGEHDIDVHSSGGGSFFLKISKAKLVDKESLQEDNGSSDEPRHPRIPDLLDSSFSALLSQLGDNTTTKVIESEGLTHRHRQDSHDSTWRTSRGNTMLYIWNMVSEKGTVGVEDQMNDITERLKRLLATEKLSPENISFVNIYLRSMQSFPTINRIYGRLFSLPNPPARVTVGLGDALSESGSIEVMLSLGIWLGSIRFRDGLHVQSRSYWAPANIGPYSQAISVPVSTTPFEFSDPSSPVAKFVYCAGQIPLVPASMEIVSTDRQDFQMQTILSLQHLWRVGMVMNVHWWIHGIAFIAGETEIGLKAWTAWKVWTDRNAFGRDTALDNENSDEVDLWAERYGSSETRRYQPEKARTRTLPDYDIARSEEGTVARQPSLLVVQVDELPRGCEIEWTGIGVAHGRVITDVHDEEGIRLEDCVLEEEEAEGEENTGIIQISFNNDLEDGELCGYLGNFIGEEDSCIGMYIGMSEEYQREMRRRILQATVYTDRNLARVLQTLAKVELVPCQSVWGEEGRRLAAGVIIRFESGGPGEEGAGGRE
ncbi:MAG: hypothetical protein M1823_002772 [Watsoniomyces obsoletus]|nr:MAG: hypothetical protein M1823_002772 [Watsoniomyces obsoletus]